MEIDELYNLDLNWGQSPNLFPSLYRSMVGAIRYLTFTDPDISFVVQQICLNVDECPETHSQIYLWYYRP